MAPKTSKKSSSKSLLSSQSISQKRNDVPTKVKPLLSVSKPPAFSIPRSNGKQKSEVVDLTGEEQAVTQLPLSKHSSEDDQLWVDRYEPHTEEELAVHKKKVADVRQWLTEAFEGDPSGKLKKYRRILVLSGPAGAAKTTTLRVMSREMGFDILEWQNSIDDAFMDDGAGRDSLIKKFEIFLSRASSCRPLLTQVASTSNNTQLSNPYFQQVVLLEDLPNILHGQTLEAFHDCLDTFLASDPGTPIVIVISDASVRAEDRDEKYGKGWYGNREVMDVRTVLPSHILNGPYVTQINFNPIAPTLLRRALQDLLTKHASSSKSSLAGHISRESLDVVVESSNGDIRSAVMALQFIYGVEERDRDSRSSGKGKGKARNANDRKLFEAVTRRESSLALFHLLGKVLYNKRKGDPPSSSASAKDKQREKDLDANIPDPPPLPDWLSTHARRPSRVNVDTLYADSPVDTSLFSLYIHQNYTQFCEEMQHMEGVSDWLSWVDSSGGEQWHQVNPHQFHLLALGTLHSLPSPVPRRTNTGGSGSGSAQRLFKPAFFDALKRTKEAQMAVVRTRSWLGSVTFDGDGDDSDGARVVNVIGWNNEEIVTELSAVLKTFDGGSGGIPGPPSSHRLFSHLPFGIIGAAKNGSAIWGKELGEGDAEENDLQNADTSMSVPPIGSQLAMGVRDEQDEQGWWLETDDIEDF